MVEAMRWALCTGRVQEGAVSEHWQPATVFAMATQGGAAAMGLEDELGELAPGKQADLVVFDFRRPHLTPALNVLGNLVHTAQGRDVEAVMVAGAMVVEDGRPVKADLDEVCRDAAKAAESVWERCRK
jgi:5-methylthioadenosine/S-adenosylhomocysteine deaminase